MIIYNIDNLNFFNFVVIIFINLNIITFINCDNNNKVKIFEIIVNINY